VFWIYPSIKQSYDLFDISRCSVFFLFLKFIQINLIFANNVRIYVYKNLIIRQNIAYKLSQSIY
jgi:hypothetical protein